MKGYVYILVNPAMPGLLKIGRTENTPEERANSLNTTGVPDRFAVVYSVFSEDCISLEIEIHRRLDARRYARNREFFKMSVEEAIDIFKEFKPLSEETVSTSIEICIYIYKLNGHGHYGDLGLSKIKHPDEWLNTVRQDSRLIELCGDIRIGCLVNEEKTISGESFNTTLPVVEYLRTREFKDTLASYYGAISEFPVVIHPHACLLHANIFRVSELFLNSFPSLVAKSIESDPESKLIHDSQTIRSSLPIQLSFDLFYTHVLLSAELDQLKTEGTRSLYEAESVEKNRKAMLLFKGKV